MNEVQAIIKAFDEAGSRGETSALATVVGVEGSAYRRPGARMLVTEGGATTGTISAGCLEGDVIEHALQVIKTGAVKLVEYDTASTGEEMAWGLGLGCDGVVRVLIEPLTPRSCYLHALRRTLTEQTGAAVATVIQLASTRPDAAARVGSRLCLDEGGWRVCDGLGGELAQEIEEDARALLSHGASGLRVYERDGEMSRVFVETIAPPVPLVLFGAGHDALPVVEMARGMGWRTEVVDLQSRPASRARFSRADKVTLARPETVDEQVRITPRTLALVMTHNYEHDRLLLAYLLASPARYIGMMGPRKRTERMLEALGEGGDGFRLTGNDRERLHAPVGLDIGAGTSLEVALSVVAEMCAVLKGRRGGMLRARRGPIHGGAGGGERVPLNGEQFATLEVA